MDQGNWKVKIVDRGPSGYLGHSLFVYRNTSSDKIEVLQGDMETVKTFDRGTDIKPTFNLHADMLQAFVDAFSEGFKPTEGKFIEGELKATKEHLKDMRTIVFEDRIETVKATAGEIGSVCLVSEKNPDGECTFLGNDHDNHPKG